MVALDLDKRKIDDINAGRSYIKDVEADDVADMVKAGRLRATSDYGALLEADTISICVPTPLRKRKGSRHLFHRVGHRVYRGQLPCGPAYRAREHILSRHH